MAQSSEGVYIENLLKSNKLKPQAVSRLYQEYAEGKSRLEIIQGITEKDYFINPSKPSAAEQRVERETEAGQRLLDVLSQSLQQQAQGINQELQTPPQPMPQVDILGQGVQLGQGATMPQLQVQPGGLLQPQQQGIRSLLQAAPQAATFETMQESFPSRFGAPPEPLTPSEQMTQKELGILKGVKGKERKEIAAFPSLKPHKPPGPYEKRRLDIAERRVKSLEESRRIGLIREKRLSLADDRRYEIAIERLGLATEGLDLDNRKYLVELAKMDEASDYKAIKAILEQAKAIAPGEGITNDLLGQAIERLKIMDTRFDKMHKRAVKRVKSWFFWEKPTLRGIEKVDPYEDLFE